MSILGDDDSLLGSTPSGSENNYAASLGRISGKLLSDNLERQGVDLAFDNDLLYLKVSPIVTGTVGAPEFDDRDPNLGKPGSTSSPGTAIGINTDVPIYTLDVNNAIRTNFLDVDNQINIDNISFNINGNISSITGPIIIRTSDVYETTYFAKILSDYLEFNDNKISSILNRNIRFDPNGTGRVVFEADSLMQGNLTVVGNITTDGNLSSASTITVGDTTLDTVTIVPDFTQDLLPGIDLTFTLGEDQNDSTPRKWAQLHSPISSNIETLLPLTMTVSNQTFIDGINNKISGVQSNEDIKLLPDTGIVYIERTKWQDNDITNLLNTPLTFASTGIGYTRFMGDNAVLIPAGPNDDRRANPELGETRWNTDVGYLECFDGTVWTLSTGGGDEVTQVIMEDFSHAWTLTLG
jgi:hypothetical protein